MYNPYHPQRPPHSSFGGCGDQRYNPYYNPHAFPTNPPYNPHYPPHY